MQDKKYRYRIVIIYPCSTSTKIGIFDNEISVFEKTIRHEAEINNSYYNIIDQYEFRKGIISEIMDNEGINISELSAVCGRGGLLRPIEGGTYSAS